MTRFLLVKYSVKSKQWGFYTCCSVLAVLNMFVMEILMLSLRILFQDKATVEMECMEEGYLAKILKGDGSKEIQVGEVLTLSGIRKSFVLRSFSIISFFLSFFLSLGSRVLAFWLSVALLSDSTIFFLKSDILVSDLGLWCWQYYYIVLISFFFYIIYR